MNLFIKQIHRHRKQTYGYQMGKVRGGAVNYEHRINKYTLLYTSSPNDSDSKKKKSACSAGDLGSISGSGRSPGEGNGYPLQYSCLENPMSRGAWWATVHGVSKSQTRLSV